MSNGTPDPAVVDRRTTLIAAVHESDLPSRRMSIAGLEHAMDARILSKDMSGPATRLVVIPAGWGSGVAGSFTADIALFVISGTISIRHSTVGQHSYTSIREGALLPGIRCEETALALLMTAAPLRYDTTTGGALSAVSVVAAGDVAWEPREGLPGRFARPLGSDAAGDAWLAGAPSWTTEGGPWVSHPTSEECFMLDGEMTVTELIDGAIQVYQYRPGSYVWRPAGAKHAGPGSWSGEVAISFNRTTGPLATELTPTVAPDA